MIYYNPRTRPDVNRTTIRNAVEILPEDPFYRRNYKRAYSSKESALLEDTSTIVYWIENGKLFKGNRISSVEIRALVEEPSLDTGIVWSTAYFIAKSNAERFAKWCGCRNDGVEYDEYWDIYSVHYRWADKQSEVNGIKRLNLF